VRMTESEDVASRRWSTKMARVAPSIAEEISMPREAAGDAARPVAVDVERNTGCAVFSPGGTAAGEAAGALGSPAISRGEFVVAARDTAGFAAENCVAPGCILIRAVFGGVAALPMFGTNSTDGVTGAVATVVAERILEFGCEIVG